MDEGSLGLCSQQVHLAHLKIPGLFYISSTSLHLLLFYFHSSFGFNHKTCTRATESSTCTAISADPHRSLVCHAMSYVVGTLTDIADAAALLLSMRYRDLYLRAQKHSAITYTVTIVIYILYIMQLCIINCHVLYYVQYCIVILFTVFTNRLSERRKHHQLWPFDLANGKKCLYAAVLRCIADSSRSGKLHRDD